MTQKQLWLSVLLALVAMGHTSGARAQSQKPIVAVFDIENKGAGLSATLLDRLSDYMAMQLASSGRYQVVPRAQLKQRLVQQKRESYKKCFDQTCQIEVGKEMAAQKTISTVVMKLGERCTVTSIVYDLRRAASEGGASSEGACSENGIIGSIKAVVLKLAATGATVAKPAPATPAPAVPAAAPQPAPPAPTPAPAVEAPVKALPSADPPEAAPSPQLVEPPPQTADSKSSGRLWTWITLGVAGALAVGGVVVTINAQSKYDELMNVCAPLCHPEDVDEIEQQAMVSYVLYGLAAAATSVVLFFVEGRSGRKAPSKAGSMQITPVVGEAYGLNAQIVF